MELRLTAAKRRSKNLGKRAKGILSFLLFVQFPLESILRRLPALEGSEFLGFILFPPSFWLLHVYTIPNHDTHFVGHCILAIQDLGRY